MQIDFKPQYFNKKVLSFDMERGTRGQNPVTREEGSQQRKLTYTEREESGCGRQTPVASQCSSICPCQQLGRAESSQQT